MLEEFLRRHDVDIALFQDVTIENNLVFQGYQIISNIGTLRRGMAIVSKLEINLHRIVRLPTGWGLVAHYANTCIVNVYAPSGTANRTEREAFFNSELMDLLPHSPTEILMAGDFNCVLSNNDCTGHRSGSLSLERLINGLQLSDSWDASLPPHVVTHFTPAGAARLDRIYIAEGLRRNKQGMETIAAAFTDHLTVLIRLNL